MEQAVSHRSAPVAYCHRSSSLRTVCTTVLDWFLFLFFFFATCCVSNYWQLWKKKSFLKVTLPHRSPVPPKQEAELEWVLTAWCGMGACGIGWQLPSTAVAHEPMPLSSAVLTSSYEGGITAMGASQHTLESQWHHERKPVVLQQPPQMAVGPGSKKVFCFVILTSSS